MNSNILNRTWASCGSQSQPCCNFPGRTKVPRAPAFCVDFPHFEARFCVPLQSSLETKRRIKSEPSVDWASHFCLVLRIGTVVPSFISLSFYGFKKDTQGKWLWSVNETVLDFLQSFKVCCRICHHSFWFSLGENHRYKWQMFTVISSFYSCCLYFV